MVQIPEQMRKVADEMLANKEPMNDATLMEARAIAEMGMDNPASIQGWASAVTSVKMIDEIVRLNQALESAKELASLARQGLEIAIGELKYQRDQTKALQAERDELKRHG